MANAALRTSYSALSKYAQCPRKYYWGQVRRLRPVAKKDSLALGSVVSDTFEQLAGGTKLKDLDKKPWRRLGFTTEIIRTGIDLVRDYRWHYKKSPFEEIEGATELKLEIPIEDLNIVLVIKVDTLMRHTGTGLTWIVERKTSGRMPKEPLPTWFLQAGMYHIGLVAAAGEYEVGDLGGTIFDMISTSTRKPPKILKAGTVSQSKGDKVYGFEVVRAIKETGGDLAEYRDYLRFLRQDTRLYHRFKMKYTEAELGYVLDWIKVIVAAIRRDKTFYPAWNYNCNFCENFPLCEAERSGVDVDDVIATQFTVREKGGDRK